MNRLLQRIEQELKVYKEVKVVSFDIFDTVLFRMVKKPADVFELAARKGKEQGCLAEYITPVVYKNVRIAAEKKAREISRKERATAEVLLEDIIENMPSFCCEKSHLLNLEIEAEKEACYLNPDILEVIGYLKKKGHRIILISDMYLSSNQVGQILQENSFPLTDICKIYMSSEVKKSKSSGDLYTHVLNQMNLQAAEVLHVGDNYITDVVNANFVRFHTVHYDVVNNNRYLELQMEQIKYGNLAPEVYALRKYMADKAEAYEAEKKEWYRIGAMVMGPIMAGMIEWVLDTAEEEYISNIYPLMREGEIISRLLKQAVRFRKQTYRIEPMYLSRKAVFLPALIRWDEASFEGLFYQKNRTVGNILDMLHIEAAELDDYKDIKISEANEISAGTRSLRDYMKSLLFSSHMKSVIDRNISSENEKLLRYLNRLGADRDFITVDLGIRGTMPKALHDILKHSGSKVRNIHLYMFGTASVAGKIAEGVDIRGYVGNAGENEDLSFQVAARPFIWEQLMMCETGTTVGYEKDGSPITKKIGDIDKRHFKKIAWCQEGMLAFQREYLKLKSEKAFLHSEKSPREYAEIVFRMLTLPTRMEAKLIGGLQYDENYGVDSVSRICSKGELEKVQKMGGDRFSSSVESDKVIWLEGLITQIDAKYYLNRVIDQAVSNYEKSIIQIVRKVLEQDVNPVIVTGAGEAGRAMKRYLDLYGIEVEAFTDSNPKLRGGRIDGVQIKTLQDKFNSKYFVIASFAFAKEIRKQIIESQGEEAVIFACD